MKKVLSIVLSVAMVICLMPAMAFAADSNSTAATGLSKFSDASSITKKEAVSVLAGLGVINGKGDGTFDPKGDVTRAETSTLVSILVRSGDSSSLSAPSKDPFTDVAKDNWAAPYVAYGVSQGYLNGRGDGTFDPTGNVTTAQLATILEQILGYSKTDVAYQWPENAMAYANEANLLTGISKGANDNLDREEAAQMIFNALKADDVVKLTTTGSDIQTGYNPVKNSSDLSYKNDAQDVTEQLVEKLFPKVALASKKADDFGRDASAWMNGRTQISDDVTETPAYKYTSAQKDLVKGDLKGYNLKSVTVYKNGEKTENVNLAATDNDNKTAIDNLTGNGVLVELYTNAKDTAINKAVVVTYTPMTVLKSANNTIELVEHAQSTSADVTLKSTDAGYDAVKAAVKGDIVLVALDSSDKVLDAYLATSVSGVVSKSTTTTATIAGKDYAYAKVTTGATATANAKSQTVYLDKYGFIVDAHDTAEAAKTASNYVYVTGVRPVTTANPSYDPYGPVDAQKNPKELTTYKMNAVTEDGTVLSDVDIVSKTGSVDSANVTADTLYPYDEAAGGYVLYAEANKGSDGTYLSSVIAKADSQKVEANALKINDKDKSYYIASSAKTITVSANGSKVSATVANGISAMDAGKYSAVIKNGYVTSVFVGKADSIKTDVVYVVGYNGTSVVYTDADNKQQTGYEVTYYEPGSADAKTMIVTDKEQATGAGFYKPTAKGEAYGLSDKSEGLKGTVASVYADNNAITITQTEPNADTVVATLADGAIRDTRDVKSADKITTADQLATAVSNGTVNVTYVTTTANNATTVTQLYITK